MRLIGSGASERWRSLPILRPVTSSAASSTRRCCSTVVRSSPGKSAPANSGGQLDSLCFTVSARVSRPVTQVYEAVADPEQLSKYFTTGGARGRLEAGCQVTWDFHDFPGEFPVRVLESDPPHRIVIGWEGVASANEDGWNTTVFEFEPLDGDTRTLVAITESSWQPTDEGAKHALRQLRGLDRHARRAEGVARARHQPARGLPQVGPEPQPPRPGGWNGRSPAVRQHAGKNWSTLSTPARRHEPP